MIEGCFWREVNGQPRHVGAAHLKMRSGPLVEGQG
jgi:hypothetical protein